MSIKKPNEVLSKYSREMKPQMPLDSECNLLQEGRLYCNTACDKFLIVKRISGCNVSMAYEDGKEVDFSYTPEGINQVPLRPANLKELEIKATFFNEAVKLTRGKYQKTEKSSKKPKSLLAQERVLKFEEQERGRSRESLVRTLSEMTD